MRRKDYRTAFRFAMVANVLLVVTAFAFMMMYMQADRQLKNKTTDNEGTVKMVNTIDDSAYNEMVNDYLDGEGTGSTTTLIETTTTASTTTAETTTTTTNSQKTTKRTTAATGGGNLNTTTTTTTTTKATTAKPTTTTKATTAATQPTSPTQYNDNDGDWVEGWD